MTSIRDVARISGVSIATVSQVLNKGGRPVSEPTRQRVLQAARQLNYHPNAMARSLILSRSDTLGLVYLHGHSPIHTSPSFVRMLDGVLTAGTRLQQNILMCTSYAWSDGLDNQSVLLDRRCDGFVLVVPTLDNQAIPILKARGIPFVVFCGQVDDPDVSTVDSDNAQAVDAIMETLFQTGHRRIAFAYFPGELNFSYCIERLRAYRHAFASRNIDLDPKLEVPYEHHGSVLSLLERPIASRPTAILGVTDGLALHIMNLLLGAGWQVPDDVSIVGYDGIDGAAMAHPRLATAHQPFMEIGARCVEILLDQIRNQAAPGRKVLLPAPFVTAESLGPPRKPER